MQITNCFCKRDCTAWAVIISIVVGILAAFLQITAVIDLPIAAFIGVLGVAIAFLAILLIVSALTRRSEPVSCLCSAVSAALLGALGSAATAIVLLAIPFAATSILGAIIVGLFAASFTLLLTATACLVRCLTGCNQKP